MAKHLALTFCLLLAACNTSGDRTPAATAAAIPAEYVNLLNGSWEGISVYSESAVKRAPVLTRIEIAGNKARVFILDKGIYKEMKPGLFFTAQYWTNGVVFAIQSSEKDMTKDAWIETWNYSITLKDQNTLIMRFVREVNNVNQPNNSDNTKFVEVAGGELKRVIEKAK